MKGVNKMKGDPRCRDLSKRLRKAGFQILFRYQDPIANGYHYKIEIGQELIKGPPPLDDENINLLDWANDKWRCMSDCIDQVKSIVESTIPEACFQYYRGSSKWLARFQWKFRRKKDEVEIPSRPQMSAS